MKELLTLITVIAVPFIILLSIYKGTSIVLDILQKTKKKYVIIVIAIIFTILITLSLYYAVLEQGSQYSYESSELAFCSKDWNLPYMLSKVEILDGKLKFTIQEPTEIDKKFDPMIKSQNLLLICILFSVLTVGFVFWAIRYSYQHYQREENSRENN